jgi:ubiquinone/menaquinone biosynthesis C-methylase UbiE
MLDNETYYDAFASSYEARRHHGYHLLLDQLQAGIVEPSARGREVLEVGCGTGLILSRLAPVARRTVGVDLSTNMLEKARARGLDVELADATALPFPDASFDVSYSFKVLAHIEALGAALAEMTRVTRPGGRLFFEFYNRHSLRFLARRVRGGQAVAAGIDDNQVFVRFDTLAELLPQLPAGAAFVRLHGVRIVTPFPALLSLPVMGRAVAAVERRLVSSTLARFGGFLVLECERRA